MIQEKMLLLKDLLESILPDQRKNPILRTVKNVNHKCKNTSTFWEIALKISHSVACIVLSMS